LASLELAPVDEKANRSETQNPGSRGRGRSWKGEAEAWGSRGFRWSDTNPKREKIRIVPK
jgi:hypothetical protein